MKEQYPSITRLLIFLKNHIPWLVLLVYASGFFIWNTYLSKFGFFEYNFIQIRYLSAGLLIFLPIVIILVIGLVIIDAFRKPMIDGVLSFFVPFFAGLWISFLYINFLFFPQYLGGARPIQTSIVGTPSQIDYLSNFGIGAGNNGGKPSVQTIPVCLIYQNDDYALFFSANNISTSTSSSGAPYIHFDTRILSISRDMFVGFHTILAPNIQCGFSGLITNPKARIQVPLEILSETLK